MPAASIRSSASPGRGVGAGAARNSIRSAPVSTSAFIGPALPRASSGVFGQAAPISRRWASRYFSAVWAAISAGGKEKHLEGFAPNTDGFDHVAFGNLNELRAAIGPATAAILVEPVQGEGGIHTADAEFLRGLRAVADEFGLLLMFDEIQCGMGRTGKLFAHEWAGVTPDIMAIAKALGGGFPVAACLATERAASCMTAGSHGSTFGGNPLAMAVANAVLDVMLADGFLDNVERMGKILRGRLDDLKGKYPAVVDEVRGMGLMIGLRLRPEMDAAAVLGDLGRRGLLTAPAAENVIRLMPPLIVEESHIDDAMVMIDAACAEVNP